MKRSQPNEDQSADQQNSSTNGPFLTGFDYSIEVKTVLHLEVFSIDADPKSR